MLQSLLKDKLRKEFVRSPFDIEDLITSTVFGSCAYARHYEGIIPFLRKAKKISGNSCMSLENALDHVDKVEYMFWPDWKEEKETRNLRCDSSIYIAESEPDLVLVIKRRNEPDVWILIEVKLDSPKSSLPCEEKEYVTDQLAKYWLQLNDRATKENAIPLCVVYLTKHNTPPLADLSETQSELKAKIGPNAEAPLYWLSWRSFDVEPDAPEILQDAVRLLREKWMLFPLEPMKAWPMIQDVSNVPYGFHSMWAWPYSDGTQALSYQYATAWKWPDVSGLTMLKWKFEGVD